MRSLLLLALPALAAATVFTTTVFLNPLEDLNTATTVNGVATPHANTSGALGYATVAVNSVANTATVSGFTADGLSGNIVMSHFHVSVIGANGGVIVTLNHTNTSVSNGTYNLTADYVNAFLNGSVRGPKLGANGWRDATLWRWRTAPPAPVAHAHPLRNALPACAGVHECAHEHVHRRRNPWPGASVVTCVVGSAVDEPFARGMPAALALRLRLRCASNRGWSEGSQESLAFSHFYSPLPAQVGFSNVGFAVLTNSQDSTNSTAYGYVFFSLSNL